MVLYDSANHSSPLSLCSRMGLTVHRTSAVITSGPFPNVVK